jgi:hypothetical protein
MSTMTAALLTCIQQQAFRDFLRCDGVVYINKRRDGFEEFRTSKAVALIIAGVAAVQGEELRLTALGQMLREESVS